MGDERDKLDGKSLAIGVDVGATKIAAALVTSGGQVLQARQVRTVPDRGRQAVLDSIAALVEALRAQAPAPPLGAGIGTPGRVDAEAGIVHNAVNLGWDEVHLVAEIRARLAVALPVWVQKDANASALGEYYFGAAAGCQDFVYLSVGSGLGGGVLTGGKLVTGANWNAAELGHLSLDPNGQLCACGGRGCAETVISGPGLLALAPHVVLLTYAIIALFPIIMILMNSFKGRRAIFGQPFQPPTAETFETRYWRR